MFRASESLIVLSQALAQRATRRAGLAATATALVAVAAPALAGARKGKKRTFCLNGSTVKAKHKKKKNRLKRQGATRGACTSTCPSGQKSCNGACIASSACCTSADCASGQTCASGTCSALACGAGGPCTVFVTAATFDGNLGGITGITGADSKCQSAAVTGGLTGTYMAWIGDNTTTPAVRFTNTGNAGPYLLPANSALDGSGPPPTVAATFAALTSCAVSGDCLENPINRDENGTEITASYGVFTGLFATGLADTNTCSNWTTNNPIGFGQSGGATKTDSDWTANTATPCNVSQRLYCFEQA
ncbi:MAG: hypothetical protein QM692_22055 [Thermomicrobiales bacterium]